MWIVLVIVVILVTYIVMEGTKEERKYYQESKMIVDENVPEEVKQKIIEKRKKDDTKNEYMMKRYNMYELNLIQRCKLENVYGTFKDNAIKPTSINLYSDHIAYEEYDVNSISTTHFTIPYDDIIDAKCDTTENLTAMRFIALGVLAFAFKKKTYYTVITYKDDLTNSDQQLIFRVDNPTNKDDFINNLLVKRNQYLMEHKKTV